MKNNNSMGRQIILSEQEKRTIQKMYGLINEQKSGCIKGDCENGTGTYHWSDGSKYEGEWRDGKRHGDGIYIDSNGNKYEGHFSESYYDGNGTMTYKNGEKYEGQWSSGRIHGTGTFTYKNGNKHEGQWNNFNRHGPGTYYWSDGSKYEGEWRNGKKHGIFILTCKDGTEREHEYDKGSFLRSEGWCDEVKPTPTSFPENWIDGINNKGWLIQKGTHTYGGRIPDTENAIKFIQSIVGANPNGIFGSETERKVKEWQTTNNLTPDGKVGKNTLTKMLN